MNAPIDAAALDQLFRKARTQNKWLDKPVGDDLLIAIFDVLKWGPTSANSFPIRIVFAKTADAKKRLLPLVFDGNKPKVAAAPVTAILGYDLKFYDWLPRLFPHRDMRSAFVDKPQFAEISAFRNGSLQAAYFMMAARALGLDCGPMSGYDSAAVDREFFPGGQVKSNFICAVGYGDPSAVMERLPRPAFSEVCSIV